MTQHLGRVKGFAAGAIMVFPRKSGLRERSCIGFSLVDVFGVDGAAQGRGDQVAFHRLGQFPAQDARREQIEHDHQI